MLEAVRSHALYGKIMDGMFILWSVTNEIGKVRFK